MSEREWQRTEAPWAAYTMNARPLLDALATQGERQVVVLAPPPGGWKLSVDKPKARVIAVCGDPDERGESLANAQLMAASPYLLDVLIDVCLLLLESRGGRSKAAERRAAMKRAATVIGLALGIAPTDSPTGEDAHG